MVTVGLVAEGTHDFIMLEPFIRAELSKKNINNLSFRTLQPTPDETGKMSRGGWARVLTWCQTYAGANIDTFFTPLFAGDPSCDIIVIHLDGDALEQIEPHTSVAIPQNPDPSSRVASLVAAVEEWLNAAPETRRRLVCAIPVQHTEAWVLAAEDNGHDYSSDDAKAEFRKEHTRKGGLERFYRQKVLAATRGAFTPPSCASYQAFAGECDAVELS
jgi:hypothetical protein